LSTLKYLKLKNLPPMQLTSSTDVKNQTKEVIYLKL